MVGIAVLALAVLNPMLCLLHCAQAGHPDSRIAGTQRLFLCDLGDDAPPEVSAPFTAVWDGPRAIDDAALLSLVSLAMVALTVPLLTMARPVIPHDCPAPAFPPPKLPHESILI